MGALEAKCFLSASENTLYLGQIIFKIGVNSGTLCLLISLCMCMQMYPRRDDIIHHKDPAAAVQTDEGPGAVDAPYAKICKL